MKAIVLGLQQSGTSLVAGSCHAAGHPAPTPYAGKRPYTSHEWTPFHEFNLKACGGGWRWHPSRVYPAASTYLKERAQKVYYAAGPRATLKNPEALLLWETIWKWFHWDEVVSVFRNPLAWIDRVAKEHVPPKFRDPKVLQRVWLRYSERLADASTVCVKFPDDVQKLYTYVGGAGENPIIDPTLVHSREEEIPEWAERVWKRLEGRRLL